MLNVIFESRMGQANTSQATCSLKLIAHYHILPPSTALTTFPAENW